MAVTVPQANGPTLVGAAWPLSIASDCRKLFEKRWLLRQSVSPFCRAALRHACSGDPHPGRMADAGSTAQDDLPGPDGDEPYVLFVNQTEYGNARYRFAGLRLPTHQRALGPSEDVVFVFMEALGLEPPLTLVCSDIHLKMEGHPIEQGGVIEISLLPPGHRGPEKRGSDDIPEACAPSHRRKNAAGLQLSRSHVMP
jgi:hypothetical protein